MYKQFIILLLLTSVISRKKYYPVTGGIDYKSVSEFENDSNFKLAVAEARKGFHLSCNLDDDIQWQSISRAGIQIVSGAVYYLEVNLSDKNQYQIRVYQSLSRDFSIRSCKKLK